jgi:hypothetical protein
MRVLAAPIFVYPFKCIIIIIIIIIINDLCDVINRSKYLLFVEDLKIYPAISSPDDYALLKLPSTQFVTQIYHTFPFTTCFGLMGPSSGTLGFTIACFSCRYSPHTGQCLHIGSALYVWSLYVLCCEIYCLLDI